MRAALAAGMNPQAPHMDPDMTRANRPMDAAIACANRSVHPDIARAERLLRRESHFFKWRRRFLTRRR